jgi:surface antigen
MERFVSIAILVFAAASAAAAQSQSIPGLVASKETAMLSYDDKLAAYDAERAVLSSDWGTQGHDWQGPNGAYGTIISGALVPHGAEKRPCRRFIHIVHHANDGGANPTFQGTICRDSAGQWLPQ